MDYQALRRALLSKGKAEEDRTGHHVFFYIEVRGKKYRATKFSHSATGQISSDLISAIAHQMRLTTRELRQLVACPLKREQWLELWCQRDHGWRM